MIYRTFCFLFYRFEDAIRTKDDNKTRVDGLLRKLSETETELNLLRRNIQNLEEEVARLKAENDRLRAELQKARAVIMTHKKLSTWFDD